jgi:hypothetical protein
VNPRHRVASIPAELDEIIMRALAKKPDDRIPGCQEFVRLLDEIGKPSGSVKANPPVTDRWAKIIIAVFLAFALLLLIMYANS